MKEPKPIERILLSNDDGISAAGLQTFFLTLRDERYDVIAVAPDGEQSTSGHSLTLHKPLFVYDIQERQYAITGTPADCVYFGLAEIFRDAKPDLIVSGINRGANLGSDVYYSGTVAAAREGYLSGIPSIAVSLELGRLPKPEIEHPQYHYETAAEVALNLIRDYVPLMLRHGGRFLWNVNVPDRPMNEIKGIRFCSLGERNYSNELVTRKDPRKRDYYWIAGNLLRESYKEGTDGFAVEQGYVSVTPLQIDCSSATELEILRRML